jgi:hypothetical protein
MEIITNSKSIFSLQFGVKTLITPIFQAKRKTIYRLLGSVKLQYVWLFWIHWYLSFPFFQKFILVHQETLYGPEHDLNFMITRVNRYVRGGFGSFPFAEYKFLRRFAIRCMLNQIRGKLKWTIITPLINENEKTWTGSWWFLEDIERLEDQYHFPSNWFNKPPLYQRLQ